jgi:hypothetical protein
MLPLHRRQWPAGPSFPVENQCSEDETRRKTRKMTLKPQNRAGSWPERVPCSRGGHSNQLPRLRGRPWRSLPKLVHLCPSYPNPSRQTDCTRPHSYILTVQTPCHHWLLPKSTRLYPPSLCPGRKMSYGVSSDRSMATTPSKHTPHRLVYLSLQSSGSNQSRVP